MRQLSSQYSAGDVQNAERDISHQKFAQSQFYDSNVIHIEKYIGLISKSVDLIETNNLRRNVVVRERIQEKLDNFSQ